MDFVRLCGFGAAMTLVACGSSHSPGDGGAGERDGMVVRDGTVAGDDGGEVVNSHGTTVHGPSRRISDDAPA